MEEATLDSTGLPLTSHGSSRPRCCLTTGAQHQVKQLGLSAELPHLQSLKTKLIQASLTTLFAPALSSSYCTLSLPAPRLPAPPPHSLLSPFSFLHSLPSLCIFLSPLAGTAVCLLLHSPDTPISTQPATHVTHAGLPSGPCSQLGSPCKSQGSAAARGLPSSFPQGPVLMGARGHLFIGVLCGQAVPEESDKMPWKGKQGLYSQVVISGKMVQCDFSFFTLALFNTTQGHCVLLSGCKQLSPANSGSAQSQCHCSSQEQWCCSSAAGPSPRDR